MPSKPTILVATDFSPAAAAATDAAAAIARSIDSTLLLAHVFEPGPLQTATAAIQDPGFARAEEALEKERRRVAETGVAVRVAALSGATDQEIARFARGREVSLVVTGSVGTSGLAPHQLGRTAERIATSAPAPVLVVRNSTPLVDWAIGRFRLRVLLCADFSETALHAIHWFRWFANDCRLEVHAGHVYSPQHEQRRLGRDAILESGLIETHLSCDLAARLNAIWRGQDIQIRVRPGLDHRWELLAALATEANAELVVVGRHDRSTLDRLVQRSTSRAVLSATTTNVLVVPRTTVADDAPLPLPRFRTVVVATDFSTTGDRAIGYAHAAAERDGTVHLIHVVTPPHVPPAGPSKAGRPPLPRSPEQHKRLDDAARQLHALVPPEAESRGVRSIARTIESPDPVDAISTYAEEVDADLLCLGTHGRSGFTRAVLGSVAQGVTRRSHRAVILVRPAADE